jgi:F-type H+-transporting ATPase subunit epsilon
MAQLTLRVITPERIAIDVPVESVRLPGVDGSIGVLPRHAPMIAALDVGVLTYRKPGGGEGALFVGGGFAEVRGDTLRVISRAGERSDEIDETRAKAAEKRARERLAHLGADTRVHEIDMARAELSLKRALMRLRTRGQGSL